MKIELFKIRLADEYLVKDQKKLDRFLATNNVLKFESAFVAGEDAYWSVILYYDASTSKDVQLKTVVSESVDALTADEEKILEALKNWRTEKAKIQKLPRYFIATNHELESVAKYKPVKAEELQDIRGFGKHKIENYGQEIIDLLSAI